MAGEAVPHPGPTGSETPGTSPGALLLLKVWTVEADSPRWDGTEPWVDMLRHAVVSSGGTLPNQAASELEPLPVCFPSIPSAVGAGRRLQALATGYARESKGPFFGLSLLVCPESSSDAAALGGYLRQKAGPAQTLLAAKRGTAPPQGRKLEDAFFADVELYELSYAHRDEAVEVAETRLREFRAQPVVSPATAPVLPRATEDAPWVIFPRGLYTPGRAAGVLGGVAALAVGASILDRPVKHPAPVAPPVIRPTSHSPAVPSSTAGVPPAETHGKVDLPRKPPPAPESAKTVDKPSLGRGDLTAEQIRQILARGQHALDRGCYTEAISLYRRVLDDDPRNGSATGGLEKAHLRMRLSGEDPVCSR